MNEAYTAVIVRGERWEGDVETEPYEAPWARECVVFIRTLESSASGPSSAQVLISPDGIHWAREGSRVELPFHAGGVAFAKLTNFGHFLKLRASIPTGAWRKVMVTLALKG